MKEASETIKLSHALKIIFNNSSSSFDRSLRVKQHKGSDCLDLTEEEEEEEFTSKNNSIELDDTINLNSLDEYDARKVSRCDIVAVLETPNDEKPCLWLARISAIRSKVGKSILFSKSIDVREGSAEVLFEFFAPIDFQSQYFGYLPWENPNYFSSKSILAKYKGQWIVHKKVGYGGGYLLLEKSEYDHFKNIIDEKECELKIYED